MPQGDYGTQTIDTIGKPLRCSAVPISTQYKEGGVTIDWTAITALTVDTLITGNDGTLVRNGDKYIRYGTVVCEILTTANGFTVGKYAPYLSTATDGRQTLAPGQTYIIDETVVFSEPGSSFPAAFDGGYIFQRRVTDIAANPAWSAIIAAMPRLVPVNN